MTGGAQEEGAKKEEEGVCTINREVVAGFWGLGGIDTPLTSRRCRGPGVRRKGVVTRVTGASVFGKT